MINKRTGELVTGESFGELFAKIAPEDRGPSFEVGEIVELKGYPFRVTEIRGAYGGALILKPHGRSEKTAEENLAKQERAELRKAQRALRGSRR